MQYTLLIGEKSTEERVLSINTCDMFAKECDEMQITIKQDGGEAYIDLDKEEATKLRDKINEWVGI